MLVWLLDLRMLARISEQSMYRWSISGRLALEEISWANGGDSLLYPGVEGFACAHVYIYYKFLILECIFFK